MTEFEINGFNELQKEISKSSEIRPQSDISMEDCDKFWDDVFGNEIPEEESEQISVEKENNDQNDTGELTYESVQKFWKEVFSEPIESDESDITTEGTDENENVEGQEGLTQEEKELIKEETGWSDEIVDAIQSMEEYRIYKDAGLVEGEVNGKKCLMRTDIDWNQKDQFGQTNRERVADGYAPLDKTGKPIQLHHIGQHADSPLAELTFTEHRTGGNDTILHDKTKKTEVHGEGNNWDNERQDYWKNRQPDGGENK